MLNVLALTLSDRPVGTDHSLRNMAGPLRDLDVTVTLAGPGGSHLQQWWLDAGFDYLPLDVPTRVGFSNSTRSRRTPVIELARQGPRTVSSVRAVAALARDFDLLHSNWLFSHVDAAIAGRLARRPVVLELHEMLGGLPGRLVLSAAVLTAGRAISVSDAVRSCLTAPARGRTTTIHQGIDTRRFEASVRDPQMRERLSDGHPDDALVAIIGRIHPSKRLDVAIDAVARLRAAGRAARLAVIGSADEDNQDYAALVRAQAAAKLPGAHTFTEQVPDVVAVLTSVDAVVVPSVDEAFGLIALEAQSAGVPVVVSDSGGLPEFVEHGRTGLVARTGDAVSVADALAVLLSDDARRTALVDAARQRATERYDAQRRARRFAEVYRSCVKSS